MAIKYAIKVVNGQFLEGGYLDPNINIPNPSDPPDGTMPDPA